MLVAEDPLTCVVRGCGIALERMDAWVPSSPANKGLVHFNTMPLGMLAGPAPIRTATAFGHRFHSRDRFARSRSRCCPDDGRTCASRSSGIAARPGDVVLYPVQSLAHAPGGRLLLGMAAVLLRPETAQALLRARTAQLALQSQPGPTGGPADTGEHRLRKLLALRDATGHPQPGCRSDTLRRARPLHPKRHHRPRAGPTSKKAARH